MLAAPRIETARNLNQLRSPMTRTKRRIDPFHEKASRPMRDLRRALTDIFKPPRQLPDQFFCAVLDPTGIGNVANIVEDIGQTLRLQIYNCGRTRQRPG